MRFYKNLNSLYQISDIFAHVANGELDPNRLAKCPDSAYEACRLGS